jgi:hypothetical protein
MAFRESDSRESKMEFRKRVNAVFVMLRTLTPEVSGDLILIGVGRRLEKEEDDGYRNPSNQVQYQQISRAQFQNSCCCMVLLASQCAQQYAPGWAWKFRTSLNYRRDLDWKW